MRKTITISKDVWKMLVELKLKWECKNYDELIRRLLECCGVQSGKGNQ